MIKDFSGRSTMEIGLLSLMVFFSFSKMQILVVSLLEGGGSVRSEDPTLDHLHRNSFGGILLFSIS